MGIELQERYASLARQNAAANNLHLTVLTGDLRTPPADFRELTADHVIANPPFFQSGAACAAEDAGRDIAHRAGAPLAVFLDAGLRRLRPGGWLTVIQRTERMGEILAQLDGRAGSVAIKPLQARSDRPAERMILKARKGGRGPLTLHPALVIHAGAHHGAPDDAYSAAAEAILRGGKPLVF